ncbi:putative EPIDERMAL PATTERNING FACTOR-like protein [Helianthus anomalus]
MALARTYLLTILLISLIVSSQSISGYDDEGVTSVEQNKKVLGSRPPSCVNKCMNCRPCKATLVIASHPKLRNGGDYYPLVWKCKCGDKLYQP